jgi:peptidoglycan/LPS O-acetylase OafA/YrhL
VNLIGCGICALSLSASLFHWAKISFLLNWVLGAEYLPWFLIGMAFFWLHNDKERVCRAGLFVIGPVALIGAAIFDRSKPEFWAAVLIPLLFLTASRVAPVNRLLSLKLLTGIGAASYSLYLLHENLGVALIGWLGGLIRFSGEYSAIIAVAVAAVLACVARAIYKYWETPLNRGIVSWVMEQRILAVSPIAVASDAYVEATSSPEV